LSHSVSPLICAKREENAVSIWIFVRRECDAEKIAAGCCKHLTVGTGVAWQAVHNNVTRRDDPGTYASRQPVLASTAGH
jgi:hypothetical protein